MFMSRGQASGRGDLWRLWTFAFSALPSRLFFRLNVDSFTADAVWGDYLPWSRVTPLDRKGELFFNDLLGFTHVPYSMLSDATLDPHLRVADQFMHDWMHMVFVSGVWNVVLNMLLESLRKVKHDIYMLWCATTSNNGAGLQA